MSECRTFIDLKGFPNQSKNEAKAVSQRVSFWRSWGAFGQSSLQKIAKGSEGKGEEGKTGERRGTRWRRVLMVLLAGEGGGEVQLAL